METFLNRHLILSDVENISNRDHTDRILTDKENVLNHAFGLTWEIAQMGVRVEKASFKNKLCNNLLSSLGKSSLRLEFNKNF